MLNPLANWRENSEKFALGIQDDDDEEEKQLEMHRRGNGDASSVSDRRNSHSFAHSKSLSDPPMSSGLDSAYGLEIKNAILSAQDRAKGLVLGPSSKTGENQMGSMGSNNSKEQP